jgi:hypothetical protein
LIEKIYLNLHIGTRIKVETIEPIKNVNDNKIIFEILIENPSLFLIEIANVEIPNPNIKINLPSKVLKVGEAKQALTA